MPTLDLTENQVQTLVEQLSQREQDNLLRSMLSRRYERWSSLAENDESRIRSIAAERGKSWDGMSEDEREDFVQDLCEEK